MIEVREPVPDDAYPVARAHVRSWQVAYRGLFDDEYLDGLQPEDRVDTWARRIADRTLTPYFLVADRDGTAVGFCTAVPDPDGSQVELRTLCLDPDEWGNGVGRQLHDAMLRRLRADGAVSVRLWVAPENHRARSFYEANGWNDDAFERTETWLGGLTVTARRYLRDL